MYTVKSQSGGHVVVRKAVTGGFVFEPRSVAEAPIQFGQTSLALVAKKEVSTASPRYKAAALQHAVANAVREALASRGETLTHFAASMPASDGMSYDRLARIQRGETMMQLTDLFNWAQRFPNVAGLLASEKFGLVSDDDF
jgi:hypothetical protein